MLMTLSVVPAMAIHVVFSDARCVEAKASEMTRKIVKLLIVISLIIPAFISRQFRRLLNLVYWTNKSLKTLALNQNFMAFISLQIQY